jgi:endonuclease/exonuclease/phosphatase family metal-dependent hydrolase
VPWEGDELLIVSVYALWDYSWLRPGDKPAYSETSLHRTLSDLAPLIDVARTRQPVVVAGDLNASTQFPPPFRESYRLVHERLAQFGLVNVSVGAEDDPLDGCPCVDTVCRHVRTLEGETPYQDDYVYASPDVADRASFAVERSSVAEAVSDHYPLIVTLT